MRVKLEIIAQPSPLPGQFENPFRDRRPVKFENVVGLLHISRKWAYVS